MFQFIEIFLIKRAVTVPVAEIGIFTVNGIVTSEENLVNTCISDECKGAFDRYPCSVAVKVGEFGNEVDGFLVVGTESHMHHDKFGLWIFFCHSVNSYTRGTVRTSCMGDNRQTVMFGKFNERFGLFGIKGDV